MRIDFQLGRPSGDARIVVAMSGGVDSSVTAALAADTGAEVIGVEGSADLVARAAQNASANGLSERTHLRPRSLSGGEQQRVAIAAAAARRAPLVLADEPTGELDEKNEGIVLRSLADLRDRFESTIVVVTHSDRVAAACDRVVALQDGKVANGKGAR